MEATTPRAALLAELSDRPLRELAPDAVDRAIQEARAERDAQLESIVRNR